MKNKRVSAVLLCLALIACNTFEQSNLKHAKDQMKSIRAYLSIYSDNMLILAKLPGRDTLIDIKHRNLVEEMEVIYSFLKDSSGRVIVFGETPIRKNNDWQTVSTHYFDKNGSTIAFTNQTIFKNNICGEKVINELVVEYYDPTFTKIGKEYTLIDSNGNPFSEKKCQLPYNTPYKVYRNSDSLLKKISLPVKQ